MTSTLVGRIELSLGFYAKSGTLKVLIIRCHDLPSANEENSANPVVKAYVFILHRMPEMA